MMWGCLAVSGLGLLATMVGKINYQVCQGILLGNVRVAVCKDNSQTHKRESMALETLLVSAGPVRTQT